MANAISSRINDLLQSNDYSKALQLFQLGKWLIPDPERSRIENDLIGKGLIQRSPGIQEHIPNIKN